jgi:hypothetical protein
MEDLEELRKLKIVTKNKLVVETKKQDRKEYLKEYYQKNKQRINNKACEKTQCPYCFRTVCKKALDKHISSKLCVNKTNKRIETERKLKEIKDLINNIPPSV